MVTVAIGSAVVARKIANDQLVEFTFDAPDRKFAVCGSVADWYLAPEPIDVYHPDRRVNDPDFHIDARNAFKDALSWGWVDVFRKLHPDRVQYTYWDYFRNAFEHNWGWRIDHILATPPLAERVRACDADIEPRKGASASDHTVLWAEFDVEG